MIVYICDFCGDLIIGEISHMGTKKDFKERKSLDICAYCLSTTYEERRNLKKKGTNYYIFVFKDKGYVLTNDLREYRNDNLRGCANTDNLDIAVSRQKDRALRRN
jgi:hypothetical protein